MVVRELWLSRMAAVANTDFDCMAMIGVVVVVVV